MPHLSPMNWILTSISFFLVVALSISNTWWAQTPTFPRLGKSTTSPSLKLKW